MKQEIETKSWVKQICGVINYKIEEDEIEYERRHTY